MGVVLLLIIVALIFGGIGLLLEGLLWLLIISLVLVIVGAVSAVRIRGRA